jgi:hypothetical protein
MIERGTTVLSARMMPLPIILVDKTHVQIFKHGAPTWPSITITYLLLLFPFLPAQPCVRLASSQYYLVYLFEMIMGSPS